MSDVQPTHLDLFSGIGGFALAARWAGFRTIGFSETESHASRVLKRHWPDIPNVGDVRNAIGIRARLVTGGFPCQPFSVAGDRSGTSDDRFLWPAMRDVIEASGAAAILAENVPGIIGMALDGVLSDLEAIGYACGSIVIPACAVNAKHRRERVWIVGVDSERCCIQGRQDDSTEGRQESRAEQLSGHVFLDVGNAVSAARIWRESNGIPSRMDAARNRAIGNAIVPQVAYQILKAIRGML